MTTISSRFYEGEKDFQTMFGLMERIGSVSAMPRAISYNKGSEKLGTQLLVFVKKLGVDV